MLELSENDKFWLAGFLEGEGSFLKGAPSNPRLPMVSIVTTDEDVIDRVGIILGCNYWKIYPRKSHWKVTYVIRPKGGKAVELMQTLKPLMGKRRQEQIQRALDSYKPKPRFSKIIAKQAYEIRQRFRNGEKAINLAKEFGITKWSVYAIHQERSWKKT